MSKKTLPRDGDEDARRQRTRILIETARAGIEAFKAGVMLDCEKALAVLDRTQRWADGGERTPEPDLYAETDYLLGHTVSNTPRGAAVYEKAWKRHSTAYPLRYPLCYGAVHVVLMEASRTGGKGVVEGLDALLRDMDENDPDKTEVERIQNVLNKAYEVSKNRRTRRRAA